MNKLKSLLFAVTVLMCATLPAGAQGDFKVSFQADASAYPVINLYVSVTDAVGQPVSGLTKDSFEVTEDGQPVTIDGFAGVGDPRPVDIVFVFDVTGSMRQEIDGVKEICVNFAERLSRSGRDYRLGLVTFLDVIGHVYKADGSLTDNIQEFKGWIGELHASGGDDDPEIALDALLRASQMTFRSNTQRILILITDAPPHYQGDGTRFSSVTFDETIATLKKNNLTVYAVAPSSASLTSYRLPSGSGYESLATTLGGKFYDIERSPDFTGIIDAIGVAISTQYKLTFRTPRPTPDGTLRDIRVKVSKEGKSGGGGGTYLERHLLNVKSSPQVGLVCLLPLLVTLIAPAILKLRRPVVPVLSPPVATPPSEGTWQPRVPTQPVYPSPTPPIQVHPPTTPVVAVCSQCGAPMRPAAKFCARCGAALGITSTGGVIPVACPRCGNVIKPNIKFCNRCGNQLR